MSLIPGSVETVIGDPLLVRGDMVGSGDGGKPWSFDHTIIPASELREGNIIRLKAGGVFNGTLAPALDFIRADLVLLNGDGTPRGISLDPIARALVPWEPSMAALGWNLEALFYIVSGSVNAGGVVQFGTTARAFSMTGFEVANLDDPVTDKSVVLQLSSGDSPSTSFVNQFGATHAFIESLR